MENLFDYLEKIYNGSEKYKKEWDFEDFVEWFIIESFGLNKIFHEGFVDEDHKEVVCTFKPDIKLDFENKTIEILMEDAE